MTKSTFLLRLREGLSGLSHQERERYVTDYSESIDDRMEEGVTEEEAVAALGSLEEIIAQANPDAHRPAKRESRGVRIWVILLLLLGFPVWGSLLVASVVVFFSVLVVLWSVVISLYVADLALAASAFATLLVSGFFLVRGEWASFLVALGTAFVCAGAAILLLIVCNLIARGLGCATGWSVRALWRGLTGRGKRE